MNLWNNRCNKIGKNERKRAKYKTQNKVEKIAFFGREKEKYIKGDVRNYI